MLTIPLSGLNASYWKDRRVIVTGGASFIGSHLVELLLNLGSYVYVIDNFSSGFMENLKNVQNNSRLQIIKLDLEYDDFSRIADVFKKSEADILFHLAAVHGGRGYISTHPFDVTSILAIDHRTYEAALNAGIEKVVYASSACVYPPSYQRHGSGIDKLSEDLVDIKDLTKFFSADEEYGFSKLMGEIQLRALHKQYGVKCGIARFVTVYGPRENETHAIIALIYKALNRQDPFEIWGSGQQSRDFTFVYDIVRGFVMIAEKINDCTPINLGTGKKYKIIEVANMIFDLIGWRPSRIKTDPSKPVGVEERALDISRAKSLLGWEPLYDLRDGLKITIEWYKKERSHMITGKVDERVLYERAVK